MKLTNINNSLGQFKILLQKYLPISWLNLYRIYVYHLFDNTNQNPLNILQKLLTTTKKILNNRKKILFYPNFPCRKYAIYQICLFLGYDVTNNPEDKYDLAIKWQDATFFSEEPKLFSLSKQNLNVINLNCQDISKSLVNQLFQEAFGYSIAIDPLTYTNKCVVKSNLNAQHDGKIISCPISKTESGLVYQKLINNEIEDSKVLDYRVPVFKKEIPFVYLYIKKNRTVTQRFQGYTSVVSVQVVETNKVFEQEEISKILCFCQKLGLDYGELDILRDNIDQQLYIVDANNTPFSGLLFEAINLPAEKCLLSPRDRQFALEKMSQAFQQEFLNI